MTSRYASDPQTPVYDVVGVGFGPANLALAIAIEEYNESAAPDDRLTAIFLEKQPVFGWHRGMLLEGATMQVSFLKDLATMRNPTSRFGFVPYLQDRGRLVDFINHKVLFPSREEFHDYLGWCADGVDHMVNYGIEVSAVRPATGAGADADGRIVEVDVTALGAAGSGTATYRARNLVLGTGLVPKLPDGIESSERVWHSSEFLHRLDRFPEREPRRFVVVGAGQSAAEVADHLHRTFAGAEVCAVLSRYGYSPADDSPYANRFFDPEAVDLYHGADAAVRDRLMDYHRNTNYGVVDIDLIDELYRRSYQEKVRGEERLRILNTSRVEGLDQDADGLGVHVRNQATGVTERLTADAIVYATGYTEPDPRTLLGELSDACLRDGDGRLSIRRDYRVETDPSLEAAVYLQGGTEHTHGITGNLLSMAAVRAGEICASLVARRTAPEAAAALA
ncbi:MULTISPECIES: lysine N(6)-hydroxylase/L-ornithine N(5)-oxygenase family protein [unclassified Streptomyces]|uniref:lysine N(6)-hydroxylase/L-ornithine N(5)-oxygenase family protein n=1 Tax=unclassified Streptomyces TaxID=2593676 RepID=UPI001BE6E389|nr:MULTISPECIES: lysine N(6)-hydroxylase/L-ornithine N(5)-oxygenase family protein [unclassified Streptomyces]MBT2406357.1 lysine N(6)-hydroxylase/L-ornithine N(5)-oxygenase family protein [Streptomyces sp. ISL-21]MBT2458417.1 lysine N(6)-hydroxylase/L-ornithine N(5)-oxygenase family protein [Streptomyces sp. ISL-86]MBT2607547.1 lysine N(6)-hydroxylase/L-ornithine N(5)-oxygenase family protein [Streptomyces sp. ISL-87]